MHMRGFVEAASISRRAMSTQAGSRFFARPAESFEFGADVVGVLLAVALEAGHDGKDLSHRLTRALLPQSVGGSPGRRARRRGGGTGCLSSFKQVELSHSSDHLALRLGLRHVAVAAQQGAGSERRQRLDLRGERDAEQRGNRRRSAG